MQLSGCALLGCISNNTNHITHTYRGEKGKWRKNSANGTQILCVAKLIIKYCKQLVPKSCNR